jgi:hypothetical protein
MPPQILLSADKPRVSVAPGASVELGVTLQNLTALLDQVAVKVDGIPSEWVRVLPPILPVFARAVATARIVIAPPRDPDRAAAGIYPLRLYAASQENPGQEGDAAGELEVQLVGNYDLLLEYAPSRDAQTQEFYINITNRANAPLELRWSGSDAEDAYWFKFDRLRVTVGEGGKGRVILSARPKSAPSSHAIPFRLETQGSFSLRSGGLVAAVPQQVNGQLSPLPTPPIARLPSPAPPIPIDRQEPEVIRPQAPAGEKQTPTNQLTCLIVLVALAVIGFCFMLVLASRAG